MMQAQMAWDEKRFLQMDVQGMEPKLFWAFLEDYSNATVLRIPWHNLKACALMIKM